MVMIKCLDLEKKKEKNKKLKARRGVAWHWRVSDVLCYVRDVT